MLKYLLDIYPLLFLGTTIYVLLNNDFNFTFEWMIFFINGLLLNFFLKNDLYVKFLWSFELMTFRLLSCHIANKLDFTFHAVQYNYDKYSLLLCTTNLPHLCPHQISSEFLVSYWKRVSLALLYLLLPYNIMRGRMDILSFYFVHLCQLVTL